MEFDGQLAPSGATSPRGQSGRRMSVAPPSPGNLGGRRKSIAVPSDDAVGLLRSIMQHGTVGADESDQSSSDSSSSDEESESQSDARKESKNAGTVATTAPSRPQFGTKRAVSFAENVATNRGFAQQAGSVLEARRFAHKWVVQSRRSTTTTSRDLQRSGSQRGLDDPNAPGSGPIAVPAMFRAQTEQADAHSSQSAPGPDLRRSATDKVEANGEVKRAPPHHWRVAAKLSVFLNRRVSGGSQASSAAPPSPSVTAAGNVAESCSEGPRSRGASDHREHGAPPPPLSYLHGESTLATPHHTDATLQSPAASHHSQRPTPKRGVSPMAPVEAQSKEHNEVIQALREVAKSQRDGGFSSSSSSSSSSGSSSSSDGESAGNQGFRGTGTRLPMVVDDRSSSHLLSPRRATNDRQRSKDAASPDPDAADHSVVIREASVRKLPSLNARAANSAADGPTIGAEQESTLEGAGAGGVKQYQQSAVVVAKPAVDMRMLRHPFHRQADYATALTKKDRQMLSVSHARAIQTTIEDTTDDASRCHQRWVKRRTHHHTKAAPSLRKKDKAKDKDEQVDAEAQRLALRLRLDRRHDVGRRLFESWDEQNPMPTPQASFRRKHRHHHHHHHHRRLAPAVPELPALPGASPAAASSQPEQLGHDSSTHHMRRRQGSRKTTWKGLGSSMSIAAPMLPAQLRRKRLPELPRLRSRFRDESDIMRGLWQVQVSTVRRYHRFVAEKLGLDDDDWDASRVYDIDVTTLEQVAQQKEEAILSAAACRIQNAWRNSALLRYIRAEIQAYAQPVLRIQHWWRKTIQPRLHKRARVLAAAHKKLRIAMRAVQMVLIAKIPPKWNTPAADEEAELPSIDSSAADALEALLRDAKAHEKEVVQIQAAWRGHHTRQVMEDAISAILAGELPLEEPALQELLDSGGSSNGSREGNSSVFSNQCPPDQSRAVAPSSAAAKPPNRARDQRGLSAGGGGALQSRFVRCTKKQRAALRHTMLKLL